MSNRRRIKIISVKDDFFTLLEDKGASKEIMKNPAPVGERKQYRPHLIIVNLKWEGTVRPFVIPLRTKMSKYLDDRIIFKTPSKAGRAPERGKTSGLCINKMMPIHNSFYIKYNETTADRASFDFIERNVNAIKEKAQAYLDDIYAKRSDILAYVEKSIPKDASENVRTSIIEKNKEYATLKSILDMGTDIDKIAKLMDEHIEKLKQEKAKAEAEKAVENAETTKH